MQRLYRFELVKERYRGPSNAVMEGRDLTNDSVVTVCEWTPGEAQVQASTAAVAESMGTLESAELFSTESAFYIVAGSDARAAFALQGLRARGLFPGEWPGLIGVARQPVPPPPKPDPPRLEPEKTATPKPEAPPPISFWGTSAGLLVILAFAMVAGLVLLMVGRPVGSESVSGSSSSPAGNSPVSQPPAEPSPVSRPIDAPQSETHPEPPVPTAAGTVPHKEPAPQAARTRDPSRAAVMAVLEHWRTTMLSNDLNGQVNCYAPKVEVFFRRKNLDREVLRSMKRSGMIGWAHTDEYEIRDIDYRMGQDGRPSVTFRKRWDSWDANRVKHFAGEAQDRLTFAKFKGAWKIVREEELRVYHVTRD
ncbi:MAG TPA: hypothetical protein VKU19_10555 [Bryobacteraceae bacterium]|nr:hypothetical protein [Bryobacteraceae bacterium]